MRLISVSPMSGRTAEIQVSAIGTNILYQKKVVTPKIVVL